MHDIRRQARLLLAGVALAASLLLPGAALADHGVAFDCAAPLPLEKAVFSADLVFVGTVAETANEGRSATVTVAEVWRGDVPSPVTVDGGLDPKNPAEDDRTFEAGVTYLFIPLQLDGLSSGRVVDGICSSTVPWTEDLASLRPPEVGVPLITEPSSPNPLSFLGELAMPLAMAGLIGGGAFVFAMLAARRRDA
jgi:hypothetical protein